MKQIHLLTVLLMLIGTSVFSQRNFFTPASPDSLATTKGAAANVKNKGLFKLNEGGMRAYLLTAPMEFKNNGKPIPLEIPYPDGTTEIFNMVESPVMEPALAAKYPEIKTYSGNGMRDKKSVIRISLTQAGFSAIILNVAGDEVYFEKYSITQPDVYFNYFGKDAVVPAGGAKHNGSCGLPVPDNGLNQGNPPLTNRPPGNPTANRLNSGVTLTTYRLALAATGEFTGRHGGTVASSLAYIVGYVNRMNAVYRNELSVSFTLVANNNLLIYTDAANDPYTGTNESIMLDENQTNTDAVIGNGNYDIGHSFSWRTDYGSGGGIAASPSLGQPGSKATGASIEGEGYAQLFYDQLLFHEIGHQFSMSHSYNSNIPVCTTRRQSTSAEPGSGATIMSYGFTCGSDDYLPNSTTVGPILTFHPVSYDQAINYMATIPTVGTINPTGNTPPVVTVPTTYTIPKSTPFALTGSATDANSDALTYNWEGTNVGLAAVPDATVLADPSKPPFFRTYEPSATGATRTYPLLSAILNGSNYAIGDKLPAVTYTTTHRLTVRDNNSAGGGVTYGTVTVNVDGGVGPFLETTNLSGSYVGNSSQTITWSVNGTNAATPNVKISLSTDGGFTFPTVLAASTPNDGTQAVTLPNVATTTARIKVESVGNIFFDISNSNFTITTAAAPITYYPKTSATDLSQPSQWTTDVAGGAGSSPANFASPGQVFNVNNNVAAPTVGGAWAISGGSTLVLNNTAALTFTPAASLTVGTGSSADFNGRPVVLKSTAVGTAFIGQITGSLTNASNVTVERYISSLNNRAYRLLSPSVNTAASIRQNWQENGSNAPTYGTQITGSQTGTGGFDATQTGQASLFTYNSTTLAWEPVSNTNVITLNAKNGYLLYVRGDRTIDLNSTASPLPTSNSTLRATGTLLTGTQTFNGATGNGGFNLVANPYPSPIDWASVYSASTGLTQFYTLVDPNIGSRGGYVTVNTSGAKSNAGSNATTSVQSGQAFFVQASGAPAPVVNIMETHKSTFNNIDVFRAGAQTEMFTSSLFYTDGQGIRINADGVTSVYNNNYTAAVDAGDAAQMANWDEDIAIARSGSALSIENRPLIDVSDTIPFTMARLQLRSYEWQFTASNFLHPNLSASLVDNFTNTKTPIGLNGSTVIPFTVTSNPASSAADRFMVVFGPNTPLPLNVSSVKAYQKERDIQVEWTAQTQTSLDKYEVEKSVDGRQFSKTATVAARGVNTATTYDWLDVAAVSGSNYYRIKALGKAGDVQYSKIVRVDMGRAVNSITVYPNPFAGNAITLSVNLPKGRYTVTLVNSLGQRVYQKDMVHSGGAATETLRLGEGLAQGLYRLTVSDGDHIRVQQLLKK